MSDALLRQWAMLKQIPRHPAKAGTQTLKQLLEKQGFSVSQRTIQRDLNALTQIFAGLCSDKNPDAAGWSWSTGSEIHDFPAIDPQMALTFKIMGALVKDLVPASLVQLMQPYMNNSDAVLTKLGDREQHNWNDKIAIQSRSQPLLPATVDQGVVSNIYNALLKEKQFKGRYKRRGGNESEYRFHALGIVLRESVVYLVATVWNYDDPRHYALHRFTNTTLLDDDIKPPEQFSLQQYIKNGAFEYPDIDGDKINLAVIFSRGAASHLRETPLSKNQKIKNKRDGRVEITATVFNSQQLRWWLLGFGHQVEVLRPASLRKEFIKIYNNAALNYSDERKAE